MLAKSNGIGGIGGGDGLVTASSFSIGGFDVFGAPSVSTGGTGVTLSVPASNNNNIDMDGLLVGGTSSAIRDSLITFSPLKDAELRRRARNNSILAKIQELEANATVQAARSERLRMMRDEYEGLVRKYANRKWAWGQGSCSNGVLSENNGYHQPTYLGRCSSQQQPFTFAPGTQQVPLTTLSEAGNAQQQLPTQANSFQQGTKDVGSNTPRSFTTVGVNTDITGPVRAAVVFTASVPSLGSDVERRKVKVLDTSSQTAESKEVPQASLLLSAGPGSSTSAEGRVGNKNDAVMAGKDETGGSHEEARKVENKSKSVSMKMEMMMMLEDEDDQSLLEAHERKRNLQLEHFHHQLKEPKAMSSHLVDESPSNMSSPSSPIGEIPSSKSNNATEDKAKLHRRQLQKQQSTKKGETKSEKSPRRNFQRESAFLKDGNEKSEVKEDTSVDTTTISLTNDASDKLSKDLVLQHEITDLSLSDSFSMFQKNTAQRKKLLGEVGATSTKKLNVEEDAATGPGGDNSLNDSTESTNGNDESGKSVIESEMTSQAGGEGRKNKGIDNETEMEQQCSSPATAGATSESLGDSISDSIQKTPDRLPLDGLELHGIAEANEKEQEEIELGDKVFRDGGGGNGALVPADAGEEEDDDVLVVTASRSGKERKSISGQRSVNERLLNDSGMCSETGTRREIKELVAHRHHQEEEDEINDAEEIRSNNLSSSKLGVLLEEEGSAHANNPDEAESCGIIIPARDSTIKRIPLALQHDEYLEVGQNEKIGNLVYDGVGQQMETDLHLLQRKNEGALEKQTGKQSQSPSSQSATGFKESSKRSQVYSTAPSANMSPSSSSSQPNTANGASEAQKPGEIYTSGMLPTTASPSQRQLSAESSSASTSQQHSFDDAGLSNNNGDSRTQKRTDLVDGQTAALSVSASPEVVNNYPQQTGKELLGGNGSTSSMGVALMPERLNSPPKSGSSNMQDKGAKEKANNSYSGPGKTTKGLGAAATTSSPALSPSSSKKGSESSLAHTAGNSNGTSVNLGGNGNSNEGVAAVRSPGNVRPLKSGAPGKPGHGGATTVPSGITGAQNTAKRVRLKLNYDDTESDSSEIGPVKSSSAVTAPQSSVPGSQQSKSGSGSVPQSKESAKKQDVDDDFDDFFDI